MISLVLLNNGQHWYEYYELMTIYNLSNLISPDRLSVIHWLSSGKAMNIIVSVNYSHWIDHG